MWKIILSFWHGNEKLWKAFWIIGVGSHIVTGFGIGAAFNAAVYYNVASPEVIVLMIIIFIAIKVWVMVSVWRCAPNTTNKIWCWAARGMIILSISNTATGLSAYLREIAASS